MDDRVAHAFRTTKTAHSGIQSQVNRFPVPSVLPVEVASLAPPGYESNGYTRTGIYPHPPGRMT